MQSTVSTSQTPRTSPLVLVVEDVGIQVKLTRMCLERASYGVIAAQNGHDALAQAQSEKPDLILLDVDIPGLNGFQVLDKLRSQPETAQIPVIMLTAHAKDSDLFGEYAREQDVFMTKPFSPQELVATVQKTLAPLAVAA